MTTHAHPARRTAVGGMLALASAGILLAGCSSTEAASDTTCGTFMDQSTDDQNHTATELLKKEGQDDPAMATVGAARIALQGYCSVHGSDTTLQNALNDIDSIRSGLDSAKDSLNNLFDTGGS